LNNFSSSTKWNQLTNNFLVSSIFARSNINEIEKHLSTSEAAYKVLEDAEMLNDTGPEEYVTQALDVGIYATTNASANWYINKLAFDVLLDRCVEESRSFATTFLSLSKEVVVELI
jgi:hypothetical protein